MPDLSVPSPVKLSPRPDFNLPKLRQDLYIRGQDVLWEQAAVCPCHRIQADNLGLDLDFTSSTSQRRPDCPNCKGSGYYYHDPITIRALVLGYMGNPELFSRYGGEMLNGHVMVTVQPEHLPAFLDRYTAVHMVSVYREVRTRAATVETLRYPIVTRDLELVAGSTSVNVLACHKADATGLAQTTGALTVGTDFDVTLAGGIDWTKGDTVTHKAPAVGERYSIAYYMHPRFVVADHPHIARDTHNRTKTPTETPQALMVQVMARLEWLGVNQ